MMKIHKYLPQKYFTQINLRPCTVIEVPKAMASKVIEVIKANNKKQEDFEHLKRVKKGVEQKDNLQILLCLQSDQQQRTKLMALLSHCIKNIKIVNIPISAPSTKQQYIQWSKLWPIIFIEQQIYKEVKHQPQQIQFIQKSSQKNQLTLFSHNNYIHSLTISSQCSPGTILHPIMQFLDEWPKTQKYKQLQSAYYLTKLWLICPVKLCGMCAMALVHSRLERIYFIGQFELNEMAQILFNEKLNHRVKMFRIFSQF